VRLLQELRKREDVEIHLVLSASGKRTLAEETDHSVKEVEALGHVVYDNRDVGAALASGSFRTFGMVIVPCSIKTVSALANGYADTLIARAGDVTLKEGRPLLAVVRETPLHVGHLKQMLAFAEMGGIVLPPMPAFYQRPKTVDDVVNHTVARVLDRIGLGKLPKWTAAAESPRDGQTVPACMVVLAACGGGRRRLPRTRPRIAPTGPGVPSAASGATGSTCVRTRPGTALSGCGLDAGGARAVSAWSSA
jgi:4-hydroxy-3-polyprenylbenzoate decarboxylase